MRSRVQISVTAFMNNILKSLFDELRMGLTQLPPGRELSLALTKLDEAEMWASKATGANDEVVLNESDDEPNI